MFRTSKNSGFPGGQIGKRPASNELLASALNPLYFRVFAIPTGHHHHLAGPMAANSGDNCASGSGGGDESACSTPFVSAPSSPARDPSFSAAGCFYSAANPAPMMSMAASWGSTSISTSPRAACRQRRPRCRRRALPQRPDPANAAVLSLCPQALLPLRGDVPEG